MSSIVTAIYEELRRAEKKFPTWPEDPIHATAVMMEEAGESIQAALDYVYGDGSISNLRAELIQTGAMVIRCLENLPPDPEDRC